MRDRQRATEVTMQCRALKRAAAVAVLLTAVGCAHTEYHAAYDCFEENGLMVFGSSGSVDCVDRTAYALSKLDDSTGVASTALPDPAAFSE